MEVKVGIVGLGRMGKIHSQNLAYRTPSTKLVAVCSTEKIDLNWASKNLPPHSQYHSLDAILQAEKIDALILSTPSAFHAHQIIQAVDAGIHVFCEKPATVDEEGIEVLSRLISDNPKLIIQIGFMRRFDASYMRAKTMIDKGKIGLPVLFRGYSADSLKFIEESVRFAKQSNGQFLDMSIHDIDLMRWFLDAEPLNVFAAGGSFAYQIFDKYQDGDNVAAFFQMNNQSMAFLFAGRTAAHGYFVETEIIGTEGVIRIGAKPNSNFVELLDHDGHHQTYLDDFEARFKDAFLSEIQSFSKAVSNHDLSATNLQAAIQSSKIALAATASFRENRLVNLSRTSADK